jgi:hypothetical protein
MKSKVVLCLLEVLEAVFYVPEVVDNMPYVLEAEQDVR